MRRPRRKPKPLSPLQKIARSLHDLHEKVDKFMTVTQEKLDALTASVDQARADFAEAAAGIQGDLDELKRQVAEGQTPDFTAIDASVGALAEQAQAFKAIDAQNPEQVPADEPQT